MFNGNGIFFVMFPVCKIMKYFALYVSMGLDNYIFLKESILKS